jgi:hypothetical protein
LVVWRAWAKGAASGAVLADCDGWLHPSDTCNPAIRWLCSRAIQQALDHSNRTPFSNLSGCCKASDTWVGAGSATSQHKQPPNFLHRTRIAVVEVAAPTFVDMPCSIPWSNRSNVDRMVNFQGLRPARGVSWPQGQLAFMHTHNGVGPSLTTPLLNILVRITCQGLGPRSLLGGWEVGQCPPPTHT